MADSESDEDNDWKKGQKRRQDSSNEDSDEDSYSEDDVDTSDESFDENMVCLYSCFNHQLSCCTCNVSKTKTRDCMICTVSWSFDRRFLLNLKPFRQQKKISVGYDVFCNRWDELFL